MHLMTDLETLGLPTDLPCPVILSIGACTFNTSGIDQTFYINIDPESAYNHGFTNNPATITWWREQPKAAQEALKDNQQPIKQALYSFLVWCSNQSIDTIWANSPSFDYAILQRACDLTNLNWPFPFWQERDYRTFTKLVPNTLERQGTHHNALDDAIHQANSVRESYRKLNLWQVQAHAFENKLRA